MNWWQQTYAWGRHAAKALAPWWAAAEVELIARAAGGEGVLNPETLAVVAISSFGVYRTSNGRRPRRVDVPAK